MIIKRFYIHLIVIPTEAKFFAQVDIIVVTQLFPGVAITSVLLKFQ